MLADLVSFHMFVQCPKPAIVALHGACIGGGIDLITACDIRMCSADAWFQIKVSRFRYTDLLDLCVTMCILLLLGDTHKQDGNCNVCISVQTPTSRSPALFQL